MHDITSARSGKEPDFRALFELLPSPCLVLSSELVIIEVNVAYLRATGMVREQILQRALFDVFPENPGDPDANDSAMLRASLLRVLGSGQPDAITVRRYDRYWKLHTRPLLDEGKVTHLIQHLEEGTQAAALTDDVRASEAKFRTIADAMPQMVWSTRPDGFHDYYNQQWYTFTGMPSGSTDGDAWSGMFHPDDQAEAWSRWRHSLDSGETYDVEYRLRHCGGEYRWVLGRALPVRDDSGAIVRWVGTCTDIHAQKLAEDELRAASRRKDDFLAMLAHELRNPLAPISTAAQLIKLPGASAQRISQASDIISRQVRHMTNLVDDLLDVSRVTHGLVQLDNVELNVKSVVNGALEQARPLLEARHHQLVLRMTPELAYVRGDRTRLIQAIANLLNNAAKYTSQHGQITLALEVHQGQVSVSVHDNGIGISPGLLPHVFELFTQAERTPDRTQGGLGLGLALVKSIASLHGGSVAAASAGLGLGSTFTILLPRTDPAAVEMDGTPVGPDAPARALNLMVVDDNGDAALSLANLLEADGHMVAVFDSAEAALQASAIESIDAFIFDIGLPDIDGYELTRRVRAVPGMDGKLLIALTGYGQAHDRVLSRAAGFDHHLVKPVDMVQLNRILASVAPV